MENGKTLLTFTAKDHINRTLFFLGGGVGEVNLDNVLGCTSLCFSVEQ